MATVVERPPSDWTRERLQEGLNDQGFTFCHSLGRKLDANGAWRELAANLPNLRYEEEEIERIGMAVISPSGSPGYFLLLDLSKRCYPLGDLIEGLKKIDCQRGLQFLGYTERITVTKQPSSIPVAIDERFELSCEATGVPKPEYLWFRADRGGHTIPLPRQKASVLVVEQAQREHSGRYCCRVMNKFDTTYTRWVEVVVDSMRVPVKLVPDPVQPEALPVIMNYPRDKHISVGGVLTIYCDARGAQPMRYQWFKDSRPLEYGTRQELYLEHVRPETAGEYRCRVTNQFGERMSESCMVVVSGQAVPGPHLTRLPEEEMCMYSPVTEGHWLSPESSGSFPLEYMNVNQLRNGYAPFGNPMGAPVNGEMERRRDEMDQQRVHHMTTGRAGEPASSSPIKQDPRRNPMLSMDSLPEHSRVHFDAVLRGDVRCSDKIALLIGNRDYRVRKYANLSTPETDIQDLAHILCSLDFKCVSLVNLTKDEMLHAIKFFTSLLGPGVYALFFFAGHGFEVNQKQYLMGVDASTDHNAEHCICVQTIKERMQGTAAKLSILLLDMCRETINSHYPPSHFDAEPVVYGDMYRKPYNTYTVVGYATSEYGQAFEPHYPKDGSSAVHEETSEKNSFFVTAIKDVLNTQANSNSESISDFLRNVQKRVRVLKPQSLAAETPWQLPEVVSNLSEDLSLCDKIEPLPAEHGDGLIRERQQKQLEWERALTIPAALMVSTKDHVAVFRLSFEAEHSNVLIVIVELLKGVRCVVEVEHIEMTLMSQAHTSIKLNYDATQRDYLCGLGMEHQEQQTFAKETSKKELQFFRIVNLQKIKPPVMMSLNVKYTYCYHSDSRRQSAEEVVEVVFRDPPLYSNIMEEQQEDY